MTTFVPAIAPFSIPTTLAYLSWVYNALDRDYNYAQPDNNFANMDEADYNNIIWNDEADKPDWATVVAQGSAANAYYAVQPSDDLRLSTIETYLVNNT